jgi:hypothetical protein
MDPDVLGTLGAISSSKGMFNDLAFNGQVRWYLLYIVLAKPQFVCTATIAGT